MGGGDLNLKKSWHPSTMKNQEKIWKAEKAASEEKKRILELQNERAQEKDREELNNMVKLNSTGSASNNDHLHWMYNKPDKMVQEEDYLLGKAIDSNFDKSEKAEQDVIPAVARRVVGSSMSTTVGDVQVDLARKLREDPLLLVKERERSARAALLNNPLQRRRLTELLRKEQEKKQMDKSKKKSKDKTKKLDDMLAEKLNALGAKNSLDLAALMDTDDSNSSSGTDNRESKKKKKSKKAKKSSKHKKKSSKSKHKETESSEDSKINYKSKDNIGELLDSRKRKSEDNSDMLKEKKSSDKSYGRLYRDDKNDTPNRINSSEDQKRYKSDDKRHGHVHGNTASRLTYERKNTDMEDRYRDIESQRKQSSRNDFRGKNRDNKERPKYDISEEERAAKLAAMVSAGAERERDRSRRVAQQRNENDKESSSHRARPSLRNEARTLPDSLESRIHSNRHYIQRDSRHMNENFAKR